MWLQSKAGVDELSQQIDLLQQQSARSAEGKASSRELQSAVDSLDAKILSESQGVRYALEQAVSGMATSSQLQEIVAASVGKSAIEGALLNLDKKANIDDINRSLTEVKTRAGRCAHLRTTHHATLHATPPRHATLALPSALPLVAATPRCQTR